jgi:hypothetical protein
VDGSGVEEAAQNRFAVKVKMAARLRGQTVMTLDWIAERFRMGCRHTVANCLNGLQFSQLPGLAP